MPSLVHGKTLLFHIGNGTNSIQPNIFPLVTAYHDQDVPVSEPQRRKFEPTVPETRLLGVDPKDEYEIKVQYKEKALLDTQVTVPHKSSVFDYSFKNVRLEILRKAYLLAWGDHYDIGQTKPRDFTVRFADISYTTISLSGR